MQEKLNEFINKKNVFAVVGASNNKDKYGNEVYLNLKHFGYEVYPVNTKEKLIEGDKSYSNLKDLMTDKKIDVVITVVPPIVTEKIIQECKLLKINKIWMQPGSESEKVILFCKENNISVIRDMCVMVEND